MSGGPTAPRDRTVHTPSAGDAAPEAVAPVRGMRLNPITLAFAGDDAALERPFLDDYVRSSLIQFRVILVLGAVFYGSFAILDHRMMPEQQQAAWLIRFGVVCPAILLAAALSYLPSFGRIHAARLLGPGHRRRSGGHRNRADRAHTRARPVPTPASCWCSCSPTRSSAPLPLGQRRRRSGGDRVPGCGGHPDRHSRAVLESNAFFLIGANLAGMATGYAMEHYARRHFFLVWLLEGERAKVAAANAELESRVEARTAELQRSNLRLQEEAAERRLAEDERLRLQQQLKQAERMETIGTLAAGVAHDLNNILVGVVAQPELLLMDLPEHDPLRAPILAIKDSGCGPRPLSTTSWRCRGRASSRSGA